MRFQVDVIKQSCRQLEEEVLLLKSDNDRLSREIQIRTRDTSSRQQQNTTENPRDHVSANVQRQFSLKRFDNDELL